MILGDAGHDGVIDRVRLYRAGLPDALTVLEAISRTRAAPPSPGSPPPQGSMARWISALPLPRRDRDARRAYPITSN